MNLSSAVAKMKLFFTAMLSREASVPTVFEARVDTSAANDVASRPLSLRVMVVIQVGRGLACFTRTRTSAWVIEVTC